MTKDERLAAQGADPQLNQGSLAKALVAARKDVHATVHKAGEKTAGGGGNYKYVGHEHVVKHTRDALTKNGLVFAQTSCVKKEDGSYSAMSLLMHESGETMAYGPFECSLPSNGKESFIASTALDRTALLRLMGVAGSADEDPEHNSNNREPAVPATQQAAERRVERSDNSAAVTKMVKDHINMLGVMATRADLIGWAGWLKAQPIDDNAKKPARAAFEVRCKQLGVEVRELRREVDAEADRITAERGAP